MLALDAPSYLNAPAAPSCEAPAYRWTALVSGKCKVPRHYQGTLARLLLSMQSINSSLRSGHSSENGINSGMTTLVSATIPGDPVQGQPSWPYGIRHKYRETDGIKECLPPSFMLLVLYFSASLDFPTLTLPHLSSTFSSACFSLACARIHSKCGLPSFPSCTLVLLSKHMQRLSSTTGS
jgi:hypothetical protein